MRRTPARLAAGFAPATLRHSAILPAFAVAFIALTVLSYTRTSATWDEPIHLTAGYAAVTRGDFRIDPSHPPLVRMWAALPLLVLGDVGMAPVPPDVRAPEWLSQAYLFAHRFLYRDNDADRLLYLARFMVVLVGIVLGAFIYIWARAWLGIHAAVAALVLVALEPNILAHSSLVTTDLGVTCLMFGAIYFLWRACHDGSRRDVAALAACAGLAAASKFTAVLLVPLAAILLAAAAAARRIALARACALFALVVIAAYVTIWASYRFRYLPSNSPSWTFALHDSDMASRVPTLARVVGWVDDHKLLPNAFTQGVLYTAASLRQMSAFLAGDRRVGGWWYYFPAAFAIKTPLALLALAAIGLTVCFRRQARGLTAAFVLAPIAVLGGAAIVSGVNLGLRHILPVYPFVILLAAAGAGHLLDPARRSRATVAAVILLAGVLVAEVGAAYPHTLAFFNRLAGGPANGYRFLDDSNLGWGQNLKQLKAWMNANGVDHINLAYFGQADPAYYGIDCTHLPGSPSFVIDRVARPSLPGYVALSTAILNGIYAPPSWRLFYRPFLDLQPVAVIGHGIRVYWVDRWPDATGANVPDAGPDAHRELADALLFGLQWPEQAVRHYDEYVRSRPDDADGLATYGLALAASGRIGDGVAMLERALHLAPNHQRAHEYLRRVEAAVAKGGVK